MSRLKKKAGLGTLGHRVALAPSFNRLPAQAVGAAVEEVVVGAAVEEVVVAVMAILSKTWQGRQLP
jgi:hypothetical protein